MPDIKGIFRRIALILDRDAARRAEDDAQRSLDRATDPDRARRNLREIDRESGRVGAGLKRMAQGLAALFAVERITAFARSSVQAASEVESVWSSLGNTLQNVGVDIDGQREKLERNAAAFQESTRFDGEGYLAALDQLISKTRDYTRSLELMPLVGNVAAKFFKDAPDGLQKAADIVGRIAAGQTRGLKQFGITTKDASEGLRLLNEQTKGAAAADLATFGGQAAAAAQDFGDLQEAIGGVLIAGGEQSSVMADARDALKDATEAVTENREALIFWARVAVASVRAVWNVLLIIPRSFWNVLQATAAGLFALFATVELGWHNQVHKIKTSVNSLIEGLNALPGVDIAFRFDTSGLDRQIAEARRQLSTARREFVSAGMDIGDAFKDANRAIVGLADPLRAGTSAPRRVAGGTLDDDDTSDVPGGRAGKKRDLGRELTERGRAATIRLNQAIEDGGLIPPIRFRTELMVPDEIALQSAAKKTQALQDQLVNHWIARNRLVVDSARQTADEMLAAYSRAFELIGQEGATLGSFIEAIARGMAAALVGGIGEYAGQKASANIAEAIEQGARALGHTAQGNIPSATAAWASAAEHTAAAAAWGALAGAATGAAARIGSNGGMGVSGPREYGTAIPRQVETRGPEIHVYVDGIDPSNPRHQSLTAASVELARQRYGSSAKVQVHSG